VTVSGLAGQPGRPPGISRGGRHHPRGRPAGPDRHPAAAAADVAAAQRHQLTGPQPGPETEHRHGQRCACNADPPALHGPYIRWTRTVNGKTVTRTLTQARYDTYASWFANARRLRELAAGLEALSLHEMARAEGWTKITPGTQAPARTKLARVPEPPITPKTPGDRPA
jgi:hypothetical protein